jgi:hypothetical protein
VQQGKNFDPSPCSLIIFFYIILKNLEKNKAQNSSYMAINQHQATISINDFLFILYKSTIKKRGLSALFSNKQGLYE